MIRTHHLFLIIQNYLPVCVSALCVSVFLFCGDTGMNSNRITITGTALDARTGLPCSGVTVLIAETSIKTTTDSAGCFELAGVPSGELFISFTSDLFLPAITRVYVEKNAKTIAMDSIRLDPNYGVVSGRYCGSDSTFLSGVSVTISNISESLVIDSAISDSSGWCLFSRVPPETLGDLIVTAAKNGYLTHVCTLSVKRGDSIHITGYMSKSISVTGTVVENDSITPIGGVTVLFGNRSTITTNEGVFCLDRITPSPAGRSFTFIKYGYDTLVLMDTITRCDTVRPVIMQKATGVVSGTVILQGKKERSGVVVRISALGLSVTTDLHGHFEIPGVPSGKHVVSASVEHHHTLPCTVTVLPHLINNAVLVAIIQSGVIDTLLDWYQQPRTFIIKDTLTIASGGALRLHPGVRLSMETGSRILVRDGGIFSTHGLRDSLAVIGPATALDTAIALEFDISASPQRVLSYTQTINLDLALNNGIIAEHCLFVSAQDASAQPLLRIASTASAAIFYNCDFIRIDSDRAPVVVLSGDHDASPRFFECIFYSSQRSSPCGTFIRSELPGDTAAASLTWCDLYASCALQDSLFSGMRCDTSHIIRSDPEYADAANGVFFLRPSSPLLIFPDPDTHIGALGPEQEIRSTRTESDDCIP